MSVKSAEQTAEHGALVDAPAEQHSYSLSRATTAWLLLLPPLLALIAYARTLAVGFLGDDFVIMNAARQSGIDLGVFLPGPASFIYRPVGSLLTWQLGWQLWGLNPLPYHVLGLLLHAGSALTLGLWLREATNKPVLAALAGALFAVFPLHIEAIGWLAAQWDAWATLFGMLSLWSFTRWWRRNQARGSLRGNGDAVIAGHSSLPLTYWSAVLLYGLSIFSKESLLAFLPLLPLSAWLIGAELGRRTLTRLALALVPFVLVLALNIGLRVAFWGSLSGPAATPLLNIDTVWDRLVLYARILMAPINAELLGLPAQQIAGTLSGVGLLIGLTLFGWRTRRLIMVACCWVLLALIPTLGLSATDSYNLANNRFLYPVSAGYCVVLAALIYAALSGSRRARRVLAPLPFLLLVAGAWLSWLQLGPWQVATGQVRNIDEELRRLIPPQPRPNGQIWYVAEDNAPDSYKGAHVIGLGVGSLRTATSGEPVWVRYKWQATSAPLGERGEDAFAMRFAYNSTVEQYRVEYLAGITVGHAIPGAAQSGDNLLLWDFRDCRVEALNSWRALQAQSICSEGTGLVVDPHAPDLQISAPDLDLVIESASFLRLRVALRCPDGCPANNMLEWFWRGPDSSGESAEQSMRIAIKPNNEENVYWTFLPADQLGYNISALRLDPLNSSARVEIPWVALDLVK